MAKYGFWEAVDGVPRIAFLDFEDIEGEDKHHYIDLLNDHHKGGGVLITPRSFFWMRVEKEELP